jgi:hypothetical protein
MNRRDLPLSEWTHDDLEAFLPDADDHQREAVRFLAGTHARLSTEPAPVRRRWAALALLLTPSRAAALATVRFALPVEQVLDLRHHKMLTEHVDRLLPHLPPGPTRDRLLPWTRDRLLPWTRVRLLLP